MSDQPPVASRESRAQVRQMLLIGGVASALGIALGPADRLVPGPGLRAGRADRHAVGRPADRLGAGLRAGRDDRPLLRDQVPHAARRGAQGRPADPRQHQARDHLDRDPGDPARRPLHLRLRRADRHREGRGQHDERPRGGRAVHVDLLLPGRGRQGDLLAAALPAGEHAGQLHGPVQGRDPRLLGPGLPHEDRRGAGDRHARPRDDHEPDRASSRWCARSCAASGTRRCARARTW